MAFRKAACGLLCAGLLAQAGAAQAEGASPLPVARPASPAEHSQTEAPPKGSASNLGQTLTPPDVNPQDLSATERAARKTYQVLIKKEAEKNGLPPDIADAVAAIESGYDPAAVGGVGEIGLMQVRPETAAMLGFKGDLTELAKPDVNIHYGVTYLSQAWRLGRRRSLPRPDEISRGPWRGDDVGPFRDLLRPGARSSRGGRFALRGGHFGALCLRASRCHRHRAARRRAKNPHGGGKPGLLGRGRSKGERRSPNASRPNGGAWRRGKCTV